MGKEIVGLDPVAKAVIALVGRCREASVEEITELASAVATEAKEAGYKEGYVDGRAAGWDQAMTELGTASSGRKRRKVLTPDQRAQLAARMKKAVEENAGELPPGMIRSMAEEYDISKTYVRTIYKKHKEGGRRERRSLIKDDEE